MGLALIWSSPIKAGSLVPTYPHQEFMETLIVLLTLPLQSCCLIGGRVQMR